MDFVYSGLSNTTGESTAGAAAWVIMDIFGHANLIMMPKEMCLMMTKENKNEEQERGANKEETHPLIEPGYDYIWGSDQDDLMEEKQE